MKKKLSITDRVLLEQTDPTFTSTYQCSWHGIYQLDRTRDDGQTGCPHCGKLNEEVDPLEILAETTRHELPGFGLDDPDFFESGFENAY